MNPQIPAIQLLTPQSQPFAADLSEKQNIDGKMKPMRFRFFTIEKLSIAGRCRFEETNNRFKE